MTTVQRDKIPKVAECRDPRPNPANTVEAGCLRVVLLTERMARIEWSATRQFEDRRSFAAVHRRLPKVDFEQVAAGSDLCISTRSMRIQCHDIHAPLSQETLSVRFLMNGAWVDGRPDPRDPDNLGGTLRTLDSMEGPVHYANAYTRKPAEGRECSLGTGLLSRSGCACVDDSGTIVYDAIPQSPHLWPTVRRDPDAQDWYILAHGRDYLGALKECAQVFGRPPLIPFYALGYWFSRYYPYTDREFTRLIERFNQTGLPLDVLVIDMDWHKEGWTGYTWDENIIPDWRDFLGWVKKQGLRVSLNLHPHNGVGKHEAAFAAVCAELGLNPETTESVPFDCASPAFMAAYFKHLHHPLEEAGVDFWWMDWQQGEQTSIPGLDPLCWLNEIHWEDIQSRKPEERPLIFSRYGGLGSGRYPIGFSGDTVISWTSLAFQPRLTSTAANVMFGYWSHDIGGHHFADLDPELYLRWLQFGLYSPILRTHGLIDKRMDEYPSPYRGIMESAVKRRYELAPYIYSEMYKTHRDGVSLIRPLYYHWPDNEAAYEAPDQYMVGDAMLLAPVLAPADTTSGLASRSVWLPDGEWWDTATGTLLNGGRTFTLHYALNEIPVFVRPGCVIPEQPCRSRLSSGNRDHLVLRVYPGGNGEYVLYEDDGMTQGYLNGQHASLRMVHQRDNGDIMVTFYPLEGAYEGMPEQRHVRIFFMHTPPPETVRLNGYPLAHPWRYNGDELSVEADVGMLDMRHKHTVTLHTGDMSVPQGFPALQGRITLLRQFFEKESGGLLLARDPVFLQLGQLGHLISRQPDRYTELLHRVPALMEQWSDAVQRSRNGLAKEMARREMSPYQRRMLNAHLALLDLAWNMIQ